MAKSTKETDGGAKPPAPPRPTVAYPNPNWFERAPKVLRLLEQWVAWKYEVREGKWTKAPYRSARPEYRAKHGEPKTWSTFEVAVSAWLNRSRNGVDGIGFVFAEGGGLVGVDFDRCLNAEGDLLPWAAQYMARLLPTYAEISPSGLGIKLWLSGSLSDHGSKKTGYGPDGTGAIEIYDRTRFFTLTGNVYGPPCDPQPRPEAIADLYAEIMVKPASAKAAAVNGKAATRSMSHSDDGLIEKARNAKNGLEFSALFDRGDIGAYTDKNGNPDASRADLALANMIAFWTGPDKARIEVIFNRSVLALRDKWRGRQDYRDWTIDLAIADLKDHYQANRVGRARDTSAPTRDRPPGDDSGAADRMEIAITTEEHEVVDLAAIAIASDPSVYQRGNQLVRVLRDTGTTKVVNRAPGLPRIVGIQTPTVRELLAKNASWVTFRMGKDGDVEKTQAHPPQWAVMGVAARGEWEHVRPIETVIESPVLRPDGTIFANPGYDPQTGILFEAVSDVRWPMIADAPPLVEARAAANRLLDIVVDFPFTSEVHRSVWLAGLLTPMARFAIDGPCPLFLFDANAPGSGKSLLSDIIAMIATGRPMPRTAYPSDDDEMRKRITSIAMAGDRLMLLDNIATSFGGSALDGALTSRTWRDRILGKSEMTGELSLITIWYGTGNNVALRGDALRRVLPCRLETKEENPEGRTRFTHPDLLAWVRSRRGEFLADALTILRAYHVAGRPRTFESGFGSFDAWSDLVRGAVAWSIGIDPCAARAELRSSDPELSAATAVIEGWAELEPSPIWKSAAMVHQQVKNYPDRYEQLRGGLLEWSRTDDLPTPRVIGIRLKAMKGRVLNGKFLEAKAYQGTLQWRVVEAHDASPRGSDGELWESSLPSPVLAHTENGWC